jgi:hypothetical protein
MKTKADQAPENTSESVDQGQYRMTSADFTRLLSACIRMEHRVRIAQASILSLMDRLRLETEPEERGTGSFLDMFEQAGGWAVDDLGKAFNEMSKAVLALKS